MNPRDRRIVEILFVLSAMSGPTLPALAADRVVWDFASEKTAWQPQAKTMAVERVQTVAADGQRIASLRIHGRMDGARNYAASAPAAVVPGQAYRLTAWLRVEHMGEATPMPYLKCEFLGDNRRQVLGQMHTESYDGSQSGKWQQLQGEFASPAAARTCWLALEKGTHGPTEIDAYLADVRLEPIPRLTALDKYHLDPIPAPLEKTRGIHPRLYVNAQRIAELRSAIQSTHAAIWKKIRDQADQAVRRGPPTYILCDRDSGDEQLWQRKVGNTMPVLAMAYLLTGQRKYLAAAEQWALASCGYKTWGLGRRDGMDLAAGHQLFGLAIVYDWCYHDLNESTRRQIHETLTKRTGAMFQAAAAGKIGWHRAYLQNHLWVNIAGMAAAGLALFDEVPQAADWIGLPLDKFRRTMEALGPDGASHEGVGYWEYGVEHMLKFMDLAGRLLGVDLYESPWWRNTASYGQYLMLPHGAWRPNNCIVDLADCPRNHYYGPDYLLRGLARRFRDPYAQGLADEVDRAAVCSPSASWLNLLWYDPQLPGKPATDRRTLHHFDDLGIVSARSGWSGDESLLVFKCGPPLGHNALGKFSYDPGSGHVHPDASHFVLFGQGEWLVRDDGYHPKWSGQHNTLLVNGQGQLGEGSMWFQGSVTLSAKSPPRVLQAASAPDVDRLAGDATGAYPKELGLKRFVRHLLFVKPDVLIVADEVLLDKESRLELRFHPEQEARREGDVFVARGKKATLHIAPLTSEGVQISGEAMLLPGREGQHARADSSIFTIRLRAERAAWRNAVAFSWSPAGEEPARVELQAEGRQWTFTVGKRKVILDWGDITWKKRP